MKNICKKIFVFWIFTVFLILFSLNAHAQISSYDVRADIFNAKAVIDIEINYETGMQETIDFADFEKISLLEIDGKKITPESSVIFSRNAKKIRLVYVDNVAVSRGNFVKSFSVFEDTKEMNVKVFLPEGAKITRTKTEKGDFLPVVFPKNYELKSDGRIIYAEWSFQNLEKNEGKSFYIKYDAQSTFEIILMRLIAIILLIAVAGFFWKKTKIKKEKERNDEGQKKESADEEGQMPAEKEKFAEKDNYEEYLKEEELQIVNILKKKEGETDQGTLRVITGFSKAHLSRLLSELEARKIIFKEKRGRKNRVFLKKGK